MSRTVTTVWHASLSTLAAILYFLFVLPRWWELTGFAPHTLGTVIRILLGLLIGATALPVLSALKQARKPEYGTPQLALTLLTGSIVAHVAAGSLLVATAISEIWLSLDSAGMWQFGLYGAAAAITLLGIGAYYLSFVAEMPPPPPKPIKPKQEKQPKKRPWSRKKATAEESGDEESEDDEDAGESEADEDADEGSDDETVEAETDVEELVDSSGEEAPEPTSTSTEKLRPSGKRQTKTGE
ncbi:hypothetical protein [[Mycobacterium] crassicus]|uniref:Transmembrane protein n=1 Tax=[Mycobacterium] crassicus TaxID=2872309 RepID=A0ABU5XIS7_9MYCO|nr:hypothetical protein [Mycolicibacter sp. MYC098]MEB3022093.1 hypothetical protein [Mycolicibacter sp. MYC098]